MTLRNTPDRYGSISIGLHWLTLVILIAVYACINLTDLYPKGSEPREALKTWHFMLGLTVLVLVALRLVNRLAGGKPGGQPAAPAVAAAARKRHSHRLVCTDDRHAHPRLAVAERCRQARCRSSVHELPALLAENKELAEQLKEVHETIGTIGYFLIGAHALAALFHHYITRDNTLAAHAAGQGLGCRA